jgi:hypothetical protein
VDEATPVPVPSGQGAAVAGAALYVRYGCINCHGPSGLGGVPNPLSEDKTIPPLSGQEFREEFNTDEKITEMIRSGSVLGKPPITSHAALGRDHPRRRLGRARRLPEDAEVDHPGTRLSSTSGPGCGKRHDVRLATRPPRRDGRSIDSA